MYHANKSQNFNMKYLPVIPRFFMKYWWIFEQFFGTFSVFHEPLGEWNTEKIPKNYEDIDGISLKTWYNCIILQLFDFQSS